MAIGIFAVGHFKKNDALLEQAAHYRKRLKKPYVTDFQYHQPRAAPDTDAARHAEEGAWLLDKSRGAIRVALDAEGNLPSTAQFSRHLEQWLGDTRPVAFLIGGSIGHHADVLAQADHTLSLSRLTMPHRLAYVVLLEQIYRTQAIRLNSPYAK